MYLRIHPVDLRGSPTISSDMKMYCYLGPCINYTHPICWFYSDSQFQLFARHGDIFHCYSLHFE